MISLWINGENRTVDRELTVGEILGLLEVVSSAVAVEVNRQLVPRKSHSTHVLHDGDEVEVVTFVGGG